MEEVRELLEKPLLEIGLILDSVVYEKEANNYFLRITIDREEPVDLDACVAANKVISKILDAEDPIKDKYILEVISKSKGGV